MSLTRVQEWCQVFGSFEETPPTSSLWSTTVYVFRSEVGQTTRKECEKKLFTVSLTKFLKNPIPNANPSCSCYFSSVLARVLVLPLPLLLAFFTFNSTSAIPRHTTCSSAFFWAFFSPGHVQLSHLFLQRSFDVFCRCPLSRWLRGVYLKGCLVILLLNFLSVWPI